MEDNNNMTLPLEEADNNITESPVSSVEYTDDNIRHLDDMEHIRVRSGMYIGRLGDGSQNDDGIYVLLKEVMDNSIDEFKMGAGKRIEVTIEDSLRVSVRDYGRGIPQGKLVEAVSKLNTGGKYDSKAFKKSVGLNGVGMIVYKFWRDFRPVVRTLWSLLILSVTGALYVFAPAPIWNLLLVFMLFITASAVIKWLYALSGLRWRFSGLGHAWAVGVTFVFITFTRLFFRSGSNLDPAIANETAWRIATEMVNQMGTAWNANVGDIILAYDKVFALFALGMVIHWLPDNWKRRYRIGFARMPLPLMAAVVVLTVFIAYQFVTAEMQPFIYFQF